MSLIYQLASLGCSKIVYNVGSLSEVWCVCVCVWVWVSVSVRVCVSEHAPTHLQW